MFYSNEIEAETLAQQTLHRLAVLIPADLERARLIALYLHTQHPSRFSSLILLLADVEMRFDLAKVRAAFVQNASPLLAAFAEEIKESASETSTGSTHNWAL